MRTKTTRVFVNSQDPESRPPLTLSPLAIEDLTDEPQFALTDEAKNQMDGQTLLDALTEFDHRPGVLMEDFQAAKTAYTAMMQDSDHETFEKAQEAFTKACRMLFFSLDTILNVTTRGGKSC